MPDLTGLTGPDLLIALIGLGTGLFCLTSVLTALWITLSVAWAKWLER